MLRPACRRLPLRSLHSSVVAAQTPAWLPEGGVHPEDALSVTWQPADTAEEEEAWRIVCSCIVDRPPLLAEPPEEWETAMEEATTARQRLAPLYRFPAMFAKSLKGPKPESALTDGWLLHADSAFPDSSSSADKSSDAAAEADGQRHTEELRTELLRSDIPTDVHSPLRELESYIYLVLKLPGRSSWLFPQAVLQEGDSMRQTLRRALVRDVFPLQDARVYPMGFAPLVHREVRFGEEQAKTAAAVGAKAFYFRSTYREGTLQLHERFEDYAWATKEELADYLEPAFYDVIVDALA